MVKRIPFWLAVLTFVAAAFALYAGTLHNPPVFDDAALSERALATQYAKAASRLEMRWLSDATFGFIHAIVGYQLVWQRVANVLLHAATAAALFAFLARLFEVVVPERRYRWLAFLGAAWFLVHPVAVYGVAYLVERSILLATFFSLIALRLLLEGLVRGSWIAYGAAALAYLLAVSSKEHAVMVPAAGAALAILLRGLSWQTVRRLAVPFFILAGIALWVVLRQKHIIGAVYEPLADGIRPVNGPEAIAVSWPLSVMNQATLFFRYLATWIVPWPGWMSIDVRTPFPSPSSLWPYVLGTLGWIAYAAAAVWLLFKRGARGLLGFGLLFPWLLALTEMAVVRVQEPFVLYRSYLWMAGFPAVLGCLSFKWRNAALAALVALLVFPALERMGTFSSAFRLWDDAARKSEGSSAPYGERAFLNRGLLHLDAGRLAAARADFETALKMNPGSPEAWVGRGSLELRESRIKEALGDFNRAVELNARYGAAFDKRCMARTALQGPEAGLPDCQHAVELDPDNHDAWINLGAVYAQLGRRDAAASSFEHAMDIDPSSGVAHYNYGVLLLESGRRDPIVRDHIRAGCKAGLQQACALLQSSR